MIEKTFLHPELAANFSPEVQKIFEIFLCDKELGGDEIRLVGGCVRDMLAGLKIKDFDFATKFLPEQIIKILAKNKIHAVPTGIKFGTITAVINHQHFEITTLRKDSEQDGRHCEPEFIDNYFFDAARRDFTINALYLDNKGLVYDYFNGISDLQNKKVKFIGDARQRIEEDYLRILRFFRFSCRYATELDREGLQACISYKSGIKKLSADRVRNEIFKTIDGAENKKLLWIFEELENSRIRAEIFSAELQFNNLHKLLNLEEALKIKASEHLKFAVLVFNLNLDLQEIFLRLNFSNHEKKYFQFLFSKIKHSSTLDYVALRELLVFEEKNFVRDFYLLEASQKLEGIEFLQQSQPRVAEIKKLLTIIDDFIVPNFPISGEDLIARGITGKAIGAALLATKKLWIESDFKLRQAELLNALSAIKTPT